MLQQVANEDPTGRDGIVSTHQWPSNRLLGIEPVVTKLLVHEGSVLLTQNEANEPQTDSIVMTNEMVSELYHTVFPDGENK